jgi:hypothetical protein
MSSHFTPHLKRGTIAQKSFSPSRRGLLQRKCACGGTPGRTGECDESSKKKRLGLQAKLTINEGGDIYEQEAERIVDQVMAASSSPAAGRAPRCVQRFSGQLTGQLDVPSASVEHAVASPGRPLGWPLQQDMEQRFGHDFSQVRVHADAVAEQSAQDVNARAYTMGYHIVFGRGQFAPETHEGRRLIAHELTHVVQQSDNNGIGIEQDNNRRGLSPVSQRVLIQRQPKKDQSATKTLKSEGIDVKDPVAAGTATIIDEVLARNEKLAPYIGDRLKGGLKIAEKGKFIQDSTDGNFDDAFRKAHKLNSADTVSKDTKGFFDRKKSEIHLRPDAEFGTALHESVHRLASPALYGTYLPAASNISNDLFEVLKEGLTAFFTDSILKDEGLPKFIDAYPRQKKKAATLITAFGSDGFDLMANFNFKGNIIEIGKRWGFTSKQFGADPGKVIREVLAKMEKAM